jgi:peroxiredoxin
LSLVVFGIVLPWVVVAFGCWVGYQILLQNGRILKRLEDLEEMIDDLGVVRMDRPAPRVPPLAVGASAPPFELPDLTGGDRVSLEQFRGQRVLVMFFSPQCGFCEAMAPDLASVPREAGSGRPVVLVLASGDADENRKLIEANGIRCRVLLQEQNEVFTAYGATGTPTGYLIDEEGLIASELAEGAPPLLELASGAPAVRHESNGAQGNGSVQGNGNAGGTFLGMPKRPLSESRLNRDGLAAGTHAPGFRLPRLEGGDLALEDFRGRRVLLVFSDPECEPCDALAPDLERLHRRGTPDLQVLMVSRGDPEPNRAKAKEHGLTFPIVLQRQWEISRLYGKFATPIAYLIDADGVIAADLATGPEAVLALAGEGRVGGVRGWARRLLG